MTKKHIEDGVYIKTACGRYIEVTADARWAHGPGERGTCKNCQAVYSKRLRKSMELLMEMEVPTKPVGEIVREELAVVQIEEEPEYAG